MARQWFEHIFNRGLSILRSPMRLAVGESYRAENVEFDLESVKRRKGLRAAYSDPSVETFAVSLLKRFYHQSAGGVLKKFLISYGAKLYVGDTDWSDSTATQIDAFTRIYPPNAVSASPPWDDAPTLPNLYVDQQVTFSNGYIENAVQSRQWLYVYPRNATGDINNPLVNIPIRTACNVAPTTAPDYDNNSFAHGLYPPRKMLSSDILVTARGVPWDPTLISAVGTGGTPITGIDRVSKLQAYDDNGSVVFAFASADSSNVLKYHTYKAGVWTTETVTSAVCSVLAANHRSVALRVDKYGQPHIVYTHSAVGTKYATKVYGGAWVLGTVAANDGQDVDILVRSDGMIHVFVGAAAPGGQAYHYSKAKGGSWAAGVAITTISGDVGAAFDSSENLHVVGRHDYAGPNSDLEYSTSTDKGATWSAATVLDNVAADNAMSCRIVVNLLDDTIHVGWLTVNTGIRYIYNDGSWSAAATVYSAALVSNSSLTSFLDLRMDTNGNLYFVSISASSENVGQMVIVFRDVVTSTNTTRVVPSTSTFQDSSYANGPCNVSIWIPPTGDFPDGAMILGLMESTEVGFSPMVRSGYWYRLTAEYDDGRLGESGPGVAFPAYIDEKVGTNIRTVSLSLLSSTTPLYYQMARDVSRMHIYRTTWGSTSDGVYYRVGSVTCTYTVGTSTYAIDSDFVDNITDAVLVKNAETILDEDVYMPPKYLTACFWKDRMVIGNLKARDFTATEGTELDLENGSYHPNRIRFSHAFNPDRFPANYFIDVDVGGESATVKRVIVNKRLDALMVFLEDDVVAVTGDTPLGERGSPFRPQNIPNGDGTPAPESVVEDGEGNIFAWTKTGIQVFEGTSARYITDNTIKPLWTDLASTDPGYADRINRTHFNTATGQKVTGVYVPGEEKILWAYCAGTAAANNRVLCLDLTMWRATGRGDGVFSVYTGWQVSKWAVWQGEGDRQELFAGESGTARGPWTYRAFFGDADDAGVSNSTATTAQISSILNLGHANFKRPDMLRMFRNLVMEVDSGGTSPDSTSFAVKMNIDDHGTDVDLGAWVFDRTTGGVNRLSGGIPTTAIGRRASLKLTTTDTSSPRPWELHTISWETEELPSRRRP